MGASPITQSSNPKDRVGTTKVPLGLLPPVAQAHTAMAFLDGMLKYGRWNFRGESVAASVYIDAALRHIADWADGEELSSDAGVHHLGHACACLFIIMDAQACNNLVDDRPKLSSQVSELFTNLTDQIKALYKLRGKELPSTPPITEVAGPITSKNDPRVTSTECILGHEVNFINNNNGYIDGEYYQGTSFRSRVERYRRGFETIDDEIEALQYRERVGGGCDA